MRSDQSTTSLLPIPKPERQALLLAVLPVYQRIAAHLTATYRWAAPRVERDDLTQIAALAALEALSKGLPAARNPIGLLVVIGRRAMLLHCGIYSSLIASPRKANGYQPARVVVSLDEPLSDGSGQTLADVLADESEEDESCGQDDYDAAYDIYLDGLPGEGGQV